MNDLIDKLEQSIAIVAENRRLRTRIDALAGENAFLTAQVRLLDAKLAKERTRSDFDLSADGRPQ